MEQQVKKILQGWHNYIRRGDVTEAVATERAALCAACSHLKHGRLLAFVKDNLKEVEGAYCGMCMCPLSAKVRSNDTCPKNKW